MAHYALQKREQKYLTKTNLTILNYTSSDTMIQYKWLSIGFQLDMTPPSSILKY